MQNTKKNIAHLLLGSNLDDRYSMLTKAKLMINNYLGHIVGLSSLYETEPWGFDSDNFFLNQVVAIETIMRPRELLQEILAIEQKLGRTRNNNGYSSRSIDIDILFYNDEIVEEHDLVIPHPKIGERLFTLLPLQEMDGTMKHPVNGKTFRQMIKECNDSLKVNVYPEFQ